MKKRYVVVFVCFLFFSSSSVFAEEAVNFMSRVPTSDELVEALAGPDVEEAPRMRGIRLNKKSPSTTVVGATAPEKRPRVILDIKFRYDSDELTEKARQTLNALGKALNSNRLKQGTFALEGHTDTTGSEAYNQQLAKRRALAAANYLQTACNVSRNQLVVKSYGESRLLNRADPESGANRRVEVVNLVNE